jgi:hypothetical protein
MSKMNQNNLAQQPVSPPSQPAWAIADLVLSTIGRTKQSRRKFLRHLGYANKSKAGHRFDKMISRGEVNSHLRQILPKALNLDSDFVTTAIEKTSCQKKQYAIELTAHLELIERAQFSPHIVARIDIHRRRAPLVVCIGLGGPSTFNIDVPAELTTQAKKVQLAMVRSLIEDYQNTENGELCFQLFGSPTHYIYRPAYDEAWEFSLNLDLVRKTNGPILSAKGAIRIGNKQISNGHVTSANPV